MNLDKWHQLREKTADLSLRERSIIAGTAVVIVVFIWLQTAFTAYESQHKKNLSDKATLAQDASFQGNQLRELTALLEHDPNAALRKDQERLKNNLRELRLKIERRMSNLVAPEDMAGLMKQVLADYKGLRLLSAKNLPVEPLNITIDRDEANAKRASETAATQAIIFTHGFEMELKGSYFQAVEYLQQLEALSGFYWRVLHYEVDQYPNARIKIQLSTLSLEEDWIGV